MSHLCKLRHRKKSLKTFRKFITREHHIRIFMGSHGFVRSIGPPLFAKPRASLRLKLGS